MSRVHCSRRKSACRSGAAAVEFAVVAPLLFTILLGSIEFARANQVANATAFAAYQGCRQAIIPGGTATMAKTQAQSVLANNLVNSSTVTISPSTISDSTTTVTCTVTVSLNNVGWITPRFTSGKSITRSCTLTRERTD